MDFTTFSRALEKSKVNSLKMSQWCEKSRVCKKCSEVDVDGAREDTSIPDTES